MSYAFGGASARPWARAGRGSGEGGEAGACPLAAETAVRNTHVAAARRIVGTRSFEGGLTIVARVPARHWHLPSNRAAVEPGAVGPLTAPPPGEAGEVGWGRRRPDFVPKGHAPPATRRGAPFPGRKKTAGGPPRGEP